MSDFAVKFIVGSNGAGKTKLLKSEAQKMIATIPRDRIATNLHEYPLKRRISVERVDALNRNEEFKLGLDYEEVESVDGRTLQLPAQDFSDNFRDILTLLCSDHDWLLLDEPEVNLSFHELCLLRNAFIALLPFYRGGYIITHSIELLVVAKEFLWCDWDSLSLIGEDDFYERIDTM